MCAHYGAALQSADPQLCLLGIGENGHLAFNDPGVADFNDPLTVKLASLDLACRTQQAAEGWFPSLGDVPLSAITVTIPTIASSSAGASARLSFSKKIWHVEKPMSWTCWIARSDVSP